MKKKIVVLGAGLVGSAIAIDLSKQHNVTAADKDDSALQKFNPFPEINAVKTDISSSDNLQKVIKDCDLVIGAVPGFMGYKTMRTVIQSGKNMVDISFMPEDFLELDSLAKKHGTTIVADCGVAPGMGNIILGHYNEKMKVESYECLVGGLPVIREWPYEYKAVFSPIDVIEEYIRPARFVQNYEQVIKEALSDPELVHFEGIGTLESWNSDGLRSLMHTMKKIPNMIEKTLRYPGCIEYLKVLRDSGFFSYEPVEVDGTYIRPIDLTAKLLFPKWKMKKGDEDFTVMRIVVKGVENGKPVTFNYDLLDRFDRETGTISMGRTTGYTCTAVANLLLEQNMNLPGVHPPENIGAGKGNLTYILKYLEEHGVKYDLTIS